jgi:tetratricopeptide (TPR) repeat protein
MWPIEEHIAQVAHYEKRRYTEPIAYQYALYYLCLAYELAGLPAKAVPVAERLLSFVSRYERLPDSLKVHDAHERLGRSLAASGNAERAFGHLAEAASGLYAQAELDAGSRKILGGVLQELGKAQRALGRHEDSEASILASSRLVGEPTAHDLRERLAAPP